MAEMIHKCFNNQNLLNRAVQLFCDRTLTYKVKVGWVAYIKPIGMSEVNPSGIMVMYKDDMRDNLTISSISAELFEEVLKDAAETLPGDPINHAYRQVRDQCEDLAEANAELRNYIKVLADELQRVRERLRDYTPDELVPNEFRRVLDDALADRYAMKSGEIG